MPMLGSELNSTQMVPMSGAGFGFEDVGRGVYFSFMAGVGRAEKFMRLRLRVRGLRDVDMGWA